MMIKADCPCYGCTKRCLDCHESCEDFAEYKRSSNEMKAKIYAARAGDYVGIVRSERLNIIKLKNIIRFR